MGGDLHSCPDQPGINIKRWWQYPNLRKLNFLLLVPLMSSFTLGFDGSMFGALQAADSWQEYFNHPLGTKLASLGAAPTIASFVAIFMLPFVGDRIGRKWCMAMGCFFIVLGGAVQAAAVTLDMYGIARAFIGFGSVWCNTAGLAWVAEIAHPRQRPTATAIFLTSYAIGSVVAAWIIFGTVRIPTNAAWRIPSALQALPAGIQLLFIYFVPDSPRHMYYKGKHAEARAMIVKYHAEGNEDDALANWECEEIRLALEAEKTLTQGIFKPIREAFQTPGNRRRMYMVIWLSICSQASGNSFISYYFSPVLRSIGVTSQISQTLINATSQILSWFSAVGFAFLPGRVGRKPLFLISLFSMFAVVVSITAASATYAKDSHNKAASYAVVAFVYLFSPAYNLGFNGNLSLYLSEILTFQVRNSGLALNQLSVNCVQLIFQYATPIGLENLGWKYFLVHVPWIVVEFIGVYYFFPETKGYALEEIAVLFGRLCWSLLITALIRHLCRAADGERAPVDPNRVSHELAKDDAGVIEAIENKF